MKDILRRARSRAKVSTISAMVTNSVVDLKMMKSMGRGSFQGVTFSRLTAFGETVN